MKRITLLILVSAFCFAAPPASRPDIQQVGKDCEFRAWYVEKGTRSEGIHGTLSMRGKPLFGKKEGESASCALGEFIWHGDWDSREHPWAKSGWLPKAVETIYPSWAKKPNKAPEPTR